VVYPISAVDRAAEKFSEKSKKTSGYDFKPLEKIYLPYCNFCKTWPKRSNFRCNYPGHSVDKPCSSHKCMGIESHVWFMRQKRVETLITFQGDFLRERKIPAVEPEKPKVLVKTSFQEFFEGHTDLRMRTISYDIYLNNVLFFIMNNVYSDINPKGIFLDFNGRFREKNGRYCQRPTGVLLRFVLWRQDRSEFGPRSLRASYMRANFLN